jgi:hypothetical protein
VTVNFKRYINTTILVSMPTLFHDSKCRPFKLLGVELPGVWLQSDELTTRLLPEHMDQYATAGPAVFVPFAHIAGILVPTARPATAAPAPAATAPAPAAAAATPAAAAARRRRRANAPASNTKTS